MSNDNSLIGQKVYGQHWNPLGTVRWVFLVDRDLQCIVEDGTGRLREYGVLGLNMATEDRVVWASEPGWIEIMIGDETAVGMYRNAEKGTWHGADGGSTIAADAETIHEAVLSIIKAARSVCIEPPPLEPDTIMDACRQAEGSDK